MVVCRGVATAAFAGLLIAPSFAAAQAVTVSPSATASAGYAATATFYEKNSDSRGAPVVTLGPAIALTLETPRTIHDLQAAVAATLPILSNFTFAKTPPDLSGQLAYTSRFELSERWNLSLGGALSALPLNPFQPSTSAYATTFDATPSTSSIFSYNLSANAHETLTRELSPSTRITQTANVVYNFPYEPNADPSAKSPPTSSTLFAKGSLALAHNFTLDAISAALTAAYIRFRPINSEGAVDDTRLLNSFIATWHRPFTPLLTGSADLGVLQIVTLNAMTDPRWEPTGGVRLAYDFDIATASLGYTHGATVNVLKARIDISDQAVLRAAIPFIDTGLELSTSIGFAHTTPIPNDDKKTVSPVNIYLADVGLTYAPPAVPMLLLSARGGARREIPTNPTETDPTFTRLTFNVNVGFVFPNAKAAAAAQLRSSPAYVPTPTLGSDSTPAPGVQPTPIELETSPPPAPPLPEGRGGESLR